MSDICSKCGANSRVTETRHYKGQLRRRRRCVTCDYRWTTIELVLDNHSANDPRVYFVFDGELATIANEMQFVTGILDRVRGRA